VVSCQVAAFIRGLVHQAVPSGNDTALAIADGLGELGRMGLLITEKFGPCVRLDDLLGYGRLIPQERKNFWEVA
jgi:epoxyqueuosine reductase QueG